MWVSLEIRDEVVDYVGYWCEKADISARRLIAWLGISRSKFYSWRERYGRTNEHNGWVPRDHWLEDWEKEAIVRFFIDRPRAGYRALTYMMMDANVVAVSPTSVYRVLKQEGLLARWSRKVSKKGTGFKQPIRPHEHWHVDVTHVNLCGTFYYLCSLLDGYSRYLVHWEIWESMKERNVEIVLQRAREKFPGVHPRIISDNGPQFIAKDFKAFIRLCGMTHVRTSPYYPQSNGKKERWYGTLKSCCIRPQAPGSVEETREVVENFVQHYNTERLHSAIGYVTPRDKLEGRAEAIWATREAKLSAAREQRRAKRAQHENQNKTMARSQLDGIRHRNIMLLAGETEAGSAGEQPARDNRPGFRQKAAGMVLNSRSRSPIEPFGDSPNASKNAIRRSSNQGGDPLSREG